MGHRDFYPNGGGVQPGCPSYKYGFSHAVENPDLRDDPRKCSCFDIDDLLVSLIGAKQNMAIALLGNMGHFYLTSMLCFLVHLFCDI